MTTINASALRSALEPCEGVSERRDTVPILSYVALRASGDSCEVTATNMEVAVTTTAPAAIVPGRDIATAVPYTTLRDVAVMAGDRILTLTPDNGRLRVEASGLTACLPTLPIRDFPFFITNGDVMRFSVPAASFAGAAGRCAPAMGVDETRYYLNGMCLSGAPGELTLAATDGRRLVEEKIEAGCSSVRQRIIQRSSVNLIRRLAADFDGDLIFEDSTESALKGRVVIGSTVVHYRAIEGTYPDYPRVIPKTEQAVTRFRVDAQHLLSVARDLRRFGDHITVVRFTFGGAPEVEIRTREAASVVAALDGETDGPAEFHPCVQVRYLIDLLEGVSGLATMHVTNATDPILFTAERLPGWRGVLMPIRA